MLVITDLKGISHALLANKTIKKELNGDHTIELEVHQQKNNALDLNSISEMWTVTYKNIDYKIVYVDKIPKGNSFYLKLRGKPLFYDDFSTSIIHYRRDGSVTAVDAFERIFNGTKYQFRLVNSRGAKTWDNFGNGETRLDLFKKAIDKFEVEFYISGNIVYLVDLVGSDTNFLYKHKLNASNISKAIDATSYYTHVKGFGDYEDGGDKASYLTSAKLTRHYTHPLASIVGEREAPPVLDGKIKDEALLLKYMQAVVDDSLLVTVKATLHDLRKQGYAHGIPQLGDRTFLLDERIDLKQEIRVYGLEERYDERDVLKDCNVEFGSQSIRKRHKAELKSINRTMSDLLNGKLTLPYDVLDGVAKGMLDKIKAVSTELNIGEHGIYAINKDDPNKIVGLNSEGWFISRDGGATATTVATADGIVASAITSGTMSANLISGGILTSHNDWYTQNLMNGTTDYYGAATINFHSKENLIRIYSDNSSTDPRRVITGLGTSQSWDGYNYTFLGGAHYDIDGTVNVNGTGFAGLKVGGGENNAYLSGERVFVSGGGSREDLKFEFEFIESLSSGYAGFLPGNDGKNYTIGKNERLFYSVYSWRLNRLRFLDPNAVSGAMEMRFDDGTSTGAGFIFKQDDVIFTRGGTWSIKDTVNKTAEMYKDINEGTNSIKEQIKSLASRVYALENK